MLTEQTKKKPDQIKMYIFLIPDERECCDLAKPRNLTSFIDIKNAFRLNTFNCVHSLRIGRSSLVTFIRGSHAHATSQLLKVQLLGPTAFQ